MLRHGIYRGRYLLHMFQQNGYKLNEFSKWLLDHWNTILIPVPHLAMILVTITGYHYLEHVLTETAITVILIIFAMFWFGDISRYGHEKIKKPLVYTARMLRLILVFLFLSAWIPVSGSAYAFHSGILIPDIYILIFVWVFTDMILPYLLLLAAAIIYPAEKLIQYRFKVQARNKLKSMPELKVVAITGSYGKTSTKFITQAILSERYRVCATPGSYNTPMGICKVINNDLQPTDQVLILEMGARYRGNIDELCRIATPDIAVITNVGVAHLESFGSVEAIAQTKGALVRHLKPGGFAVLNGDDPEVRKMNNRDDISVLFAGLSEEENHIFGKNISYDDQGCAFEMQVKDEVPAGGGTFVMMKEEEQIRMPLLGQHNVRNALLAASAGLIMKLRLPTIKVALRKVEPVEHRLELKKKDGIVVIDDAFNSNPVGARNAISVLSSFKAGRKFVITPGMIELGDRQVTENRDFGIWMARHRPDHVFLVGKQQTKPVYEGLREGGYDDGRITVVNSLFEANEKISEYLREGDVVLYENDLPDNYSE